MQRGLDDQLTAPATSRTSLFPGVLPVLTHWLSHVHRYRRAGDDPFSGASLYACRCGVVRPGM